MKRITWEENQRLPLGIRAVLAALAFETPARSELGLLDEREWRETLDFCDRSQLTLVLGDRHGERLPEAVRERVAGNLAANSRRLERIERDVFEIAGALEKAGASFVTLKGLAQWPRYVRDPRLRVQYDLDLYCPPGALDAAREELVRLGYESGGSLEDFPVDHLPTMIRRTGWQWRGDYYDPEIPVSVDVHFRFWDEETERFPAPGIGRFWERRTWQAYRDRTLSVLHPADGLAYAALHLLRHLLRGSLRLCHAYEIAYFLEENANDEEFWREWRRLHEPGLRRLEAIVFRLASDWFGCRLSAAAAEEVRELPAPIQQWFLERAAAPVEGLIHPNKDEVLLHLLLLDSFRDSASVLRRRLLPARLPGRGGPGGVRPGDVTRSMIRSARHRYVRSVAARTWHHARTLFPTLAKCFSCWVRGRGLQGPFWRFLAAASLYHLGVFNFVLLYNLYLLDKGFREDFLGLVTGAATAGNLAGALPAAWLARRYGLRRTMLACFAGVAAVSALRCLPSGTYLLLGAAFLGGAFSSLWFVLVAPAVSGLTSEQSRAAGFSLFFGTGIAVGIVGGVAGGHLPALLAQAGRVAGGKQAALLVGCGITAMAIWPAARLRFHEPAAHEPRTYPWNPFLAKFLPLLAAWSLATGMFNPFFTAFFARHLGANEPRIGLVFSTSQLVQVAGVLLAPLVLRRFGLIGGLVNLQLAASFALAWLAAGPPLLAAGALYAGYMTFQSMCEPGMYTLLMDHVRSAERSGASALNFAVVFASHAVAASLAGLLIERSGYPAMIAAAAALAASAALLFRGLFTETKPAVMACDAKE